MDKKLKYYDEILEPVRLRSRERKKMVHLMVDKIESMRNDKVPWREIAYRLDRSVSSIIELYNRHKKGQTKVKTTKHRSRNYHKKYYREKIRPNERLMEIRRARSCIRYHEHDE